MLTEYPNLKNAPIIEALIDIRVKLSSEFDVAKIDSIYNSIKEKYPIREEQRIAEVEFEVKDEEHIRQSKLKTNGYRYITPDRKQILQVRMDGFTFSRLRPYINWENLRNEALDLWKQYKEITAPESIVRVALRYINILDIPLPIIDINDYLNAAPQVPKDLPQAISEFFARIVIREPSINAVAIITQALQQITREKAPIIFDIDVFRYQSDGLDEKETCQTLEQFRNFKNDIFFRSITNRLVEIYK